MRCFRSRSEHRSSRTSAIYSVIAIAVLFGLPAPSSADQRDFPFTYSWIQAGYRERELAYHGLYAPRQNLWQHELEFEYGVTRRLSIAPYLVLEHGDGRSFHYDAFKIETRYQLGNYKQNAILPGLYLEYEKANDEHGELEGKLILSRFDKRGGNISFNYIIQAVLHSGFSAEHSYSIGYARPLGSGRAGAELIHYVSGDRLLVGPTYFMPIGPGSSLTAGLAFPVTSRNQNGIEFRVFIQRHWF